MLEALRCPVVLVRVHQQVHIGRVHIKSGSGKGGSSGFIILFSVDFDKTFVDLNTFGIHMTFERHSWVSNRAIIP